MRLPSTPAVLQHLQSWVRFPVALLRRGGRASRHVARLALHRLEALLLPLSDRPLLCCSAGLLAGSVLGTAVPLSPSLIGTMLLVAGIMCRCWSRTHLQRGCR